MAEGKFVQVAEGSTRKKMHVKLCLFRDVMMVCEKPARSFVDSLFGAKHLQESMAEGSAYEFVELVPNKNVSVMDIERTSFYSVRWRLVNDLC